MTDALRLLSLALFAVGPVVALTALLHRGLDPSPMRSRIKSWRWYVPAVLLPAEWLLPPILIALRIGEIEVGWLPVRVIGLAVGLAGAVLLIWSAALLGRFMMHEAALREDHVLIGNGPYRFVRHPCRRVSARYRADCSLNPSAFWRMLIGILIRASESNSGGQVRPGTSVIRRTGLLVPASGAANRCCT